MQVFCPAADITTLQDNVKESKFDIAFMKTFDIVLNGLDNVEARRHVNRLCLAAEVPLVESGTTGYKGQVRHRAVLWARPRLHYARHTGAAALTILSNLCRAGTSRDR